MNSKSARNTTITIIDELIRICSALATDIANLFYFAFFGHPLREATEEGLG